MARRYFVRQDPTWPNRCVLRLSNGVEQHYWAPTQGGYVRNVTKQPGTLGPQVCEGLAGSGSTLAWSGNYPLAELIRREARRAGSAIEDMLLFSTDSSS